MLRGWGSGHPHDVLTFGRYWTPIGTNELLKVWDMQMNPGLVTVSPSTAFRMDQVGLPIIQPMDPQAQQRAAGGWNVPEVFNLSFLRLQGASEGDGVTFGMKGIAWTPQEAKRINQQLQTCCSTFYMHYLKPMKVIVRVVTEEIR